MLTCSERRAQQLLTQPQPTLCQDAVQPKEKKDQAGTSPHAGPSSCDSLDFSSPHSEAQLHQTLGWGRALITLGINSDNTQVGEAAPMGMGTP